MAWVVAPEEFMLENKVEETIQKYNLIPRDESVLVGVSGGADSMSLLHYLCNSISNAGSRLKVAHLDHGFREKSKEETDFVRRMCRKLEVPFYGARINVPYYREKWGLSAQEAARLARLYFYWKAASYFKVRIVATGHHRDDQVETVLLNFLHGSGLDGLTGMQVSRRFRNLTLIRPLIEVSKEEINSYCMEQGISYIQDESNFKNIYRRNKVRRELLPQLEEYNPRIKEALYQLGRILEADRSYLEKQTRSYFARSARVETGRVVIKCSTFKEMPLSMQRRLIRMAYSLAVGVKYKPAFMHVEDMVNLACHGQTGKELDLPGGGLAYKTSRELIIQRFSSCVDSPAPVPLNIPGSTYIPGFNLTLYTAIKEVHELSWPPAVNQAYVDYQRISLPLYVRAREPGDRFKPLGLNQAKKVKDLFIDLKVPRQERDSCPLITTSNNEIAWVAGYRVSEDFKVTGETQKVLVISMVKTNNSG